MMPHQSGNLMYNQTISNNQSNTSFEQGSKTPVDCQGSSEVQSLHGNMKQMLHDDDHENDKISPDRKNEL